MNAPADLPGLRALIERMNGANRSVLVGVPAGAERKPKEKTAKGKGAQPSDEANMATIAAVHEFGSPEHNIPERSFLRGGIKRAESKLKAINADSLRKIVRGEMTVEQAIERLGVAAAGEVKREFVAGEFAPLKPETIKRKRSSRPLIDTAQLRQSISYVVEGEQSPNARVI